ncbi:FadR/GntR family transcriptional regulator [Streptomyces himalayensis]|uniref:FadR family transcriptional regulator n=1 Tax=Streptomyces himalayensis subsp. himalayensis TaxID=2756131 RepID=A0A7W0IDN8_9ACTN|nr:FCD domain-containing protein [Streptomyces himalayensis]MBA2951216.1 FadR family transcriptional regulator [Streptomyces himalayensis subsp. himalayensis]
MVDEQRPLLAGLRAPGGTRAEQLAAALESRIRGLNPGSPVGTIEEIRQESGLARATVSEAVRLLRDRGVIVIRPGRGGGLFVADQSPVVRLRHTLLGVAGEPGTVADAIELRNHLEELIAVGAARCRGEDDLPPLRSCLDDMEAAPDWDAFMRANWALHERIAQLCPNAMARAVYRGTLGHLTSSTARAADRDADAYRARRLRIHADLVEAIAAGDEDAVRAAVARHNHTD